MITTMLCTAEAEATCQGRQRGLAQRRRAFRVLVHRLRTLQPEGNIRGTILPCDTNLLYSSKHQTRKLFLGAWCCPGILSIADLAEMWPLSTQN